MSAVRSFIWWSRFFLRVHTICMLTQFLIFGISGWMMEIIWTGLASLLKRNYKLTSTTSIWMFFIYGLAAFTGPICDALNMMPLVVRGGIYTVCIFGDSCRPCKYQRILHCRRSGTGCDHHIRQVYIHTGRRASF